MIQAIGFTPTDALHVLGDYTEWDVEASQIGAKKLSRFTQMGVYAFCKTVKQQVARNMAYSLMFFILEGRGKEGIKKMLEKEIPAQYSTSVLHQLDQKIIYPHYDFKHLTEKYFEIGMKLDDFLIQLVKYCSTR